MTVALVDASGNTVGTTTTDANGKYFFDVNPGTYSIKVTAPAGYVISPKNQGGDDALDSDLNADGSSDTVTVSGSRFDQARIPPGITWRIPSAATPPVAEPCHGAGFAPVRIANRWLLLAMYSVSPTAIGVE